MDLGQLISAFPKALGNWADADDRGLVSESSTGFRLPNGAVRSPDASWLSKRKARGLTKKQQIGFAPICPEFVVELTSPSDKLKIVRAKMEEWMANGAKLAWLIEPKERRVTVYRSGEEPQVLHEATSVQGTGCVAGFEVVMERVWG